MVLTKEFSLLFLIFVKCSQGEASGFGSFVKQVVDPLHLYFPEENAGDITRSEKLLERIKTGEYNFRVEQQFRIYNSSIPNISDHYEANLLHIDGYNGCLGFTTDALEIIVLQCPEKEPEQPRCYDVLVPKLSDQDSAMTYERKDERICARTINSGCVGITTQENTTIMLVCPGRVGKIVSVQRNGKPEEK